MAWHAEMVLARPFDSIVDIIVGDALANSRAVMIVARATAKGSRCRDAE